MIFSSFVNSQVWLIVTCSPVNSIYFTIEATAVQQGQRNKTRPPAEGAFRLSAE